VFGIGWTEFIVISLVLLIFVGPRHLPAVFRKTGMIINELKNASRELRNQVSQEVRELEDVIGDVKSPQALIRDLELDITDEGSPYAEVRRAEAEIKEEIVSIKESIENKGSSPASENRAPDNSPVSKETGATKTVAPAAETKTFKKDG